MRVPRAFVGKAPPWGGGGGARGEYEDGRPPLALPWEPHGQAQQVDRQLGMALREVGPLGLP